MKTFNLLSRVRMLILIYACAMPVPVSAIEIESDAIISDSFLEFRDTYEVLEALAKLIRSYGWKCDSISVASTFVFSVGFNLTCNQFRYSYEISDKGGRWVVELD